MMIITVSHCNNVWLIIRVCIIADAKDYMEPVVETSAKCPLFPQACQITVKPLFERHL